MKAMIFAAGQGTRLRPLTEKIPKALVPVAGRPMIDYPLLLLKHHGIRDIIINLHHLGDQIEDHLGNGEKFGLKIAYSKEAELLDTGGGLLKAKPFLADGTFVVINTDVLIDLSLAEVLSYHAHRKTIATLVLRPEALAEQYGSMDIDSDGRILRFLDAKLPMAAPPSSAKLMFTGVHVLEPKIYDYMGETGRFSITRATYPKVLTGGEPIHGFIHRGFWSDLGTTKSIKQAEQKLLTGEVKPHFLLT